MIGRRPGQLRPLTTYNQGGSQMPVYVIMDDVKYDTSAPCNDEQTVRQLRVLAHHVSEHLGCFCLFGFDNHGKPVKVGNISSAMEDMAITKLIEEDMMGAMGSPRELPDENEDQGLF
jgi:hypothetical protein